MVKPANIQCVTRDSASYPPLLREIFDPPARLYIRGVLPDPEKPAVAVVGTRRPGAAAMRDALRLGRELAERGITVISGLALGIDALAHRGCLDAGGVTVAVLGSGVDQVYPASNRDLARRIIDNGGALASEYECGTKPLKWHFPARNRIISGWARGVVIVEAPEKSGALHTARFALEQGRDLWVAPAGAVSGRGRGTQALVNDGCAVITGAADIVAEWRMVSPDREKSGARNPPGNTGAALAESLQKELAL
ncbi:MAG: DNA-processing protein DprA [Treponema sp.]|jgi:DNA processing protein|nr:DNA-processing protein DprA [Treponema sp.]